MRVCGFDSGCCDARRGAGAARGGLGGLSERRADAGWMWWWMRGYGVDLHPVVHLGWPPRLSCAKWCVGGGVDGVDAGRQNPARAGSGVLLVGGL